MIHTHNHSLTYLFTAEDIGIWDLALRVIAFLSVLTNGALVFFTGSYFNNLMWSERWMLFILVEHVTFLLMYAVDLSMSETPVEVAMQLQRQSFLVSKVLWNAADEGADTHHTQYGDRVSDDIRVAITDKDWVYTVDEDAPLTAADLLGADRRSTKGDAVAAAAAAASSPSATATATVDVAAGRGQSTGPTRRTSRI